MKECGITRKDLAKRVGWTPKKMKRVLGGDRISMKQMCKLLLAMGYHAKITAEAGCSHFRSPAVQPVKEDLDKGSVPPSGVDLICKTLTLIKMLHDDAKNCCPGEQVVLAPSTYKQVNDALQEAMLLGQEP